MVTEANDLPLLGYVDRLSARPGDKLNFKVSSTASKPFKAHLVRSISADPNPGGPGVVEDDASQYFTPARFPSVHRPFLAGSYGVGQASIDAYPTS